MKYSMLENGLDFIITGLEHLQNAEQENMTEIMRDRELKYSLLHLSAGIELVFKSRLNIEHWLYIFDDMNHASKDKYKDGSLKTVDSNTAIERLEKLCGYSFSNKQKESLKRLREARNRFEHGAIDNNPKAIESVINNAVEVIIDFLGKNYDEFEIPTNMLSDGMTVREKEYYKNLQMVTKKLKNHHDDAVKLALSRALNITMQEDLIECPECGEVLLRHGDGGTQCECYYCGYSEKPVDVAKKYIDKVLNVSEYEVGHHGGEIPLYSCPDCSIDSLVKTDLSFFCFNCGIKYQLNELVHCERCGKLFYPVDDDIVCEDCINKQMNE